MKTYTKPQNLNGTELIKELADVGILVDAVFDNANGTISLPTNDDNAEAVVAAHNGTIIAPELTIEDKLSSVGLSLPDLKAALGL